MGRKRNKPSEFIHPKNPINKHALAKIVTKTDKNMTTLDMKIFKWIKGEENNEIWLGPMDKDPQRYAFNYSKTVIIDGVTYHLHPSCYRCR